MGKSWRDQDEEEILGGRSGLKVIRSGGGDGTWKSKQFYLARTRGREQKGGGRAWMDLALGTLNVRLKSSLGFLGGSLQVSEQRSS